MYTFLCSDAIIGFKQLSYLISEESGSVDVCVEISDVPSGGVGNNITVFLVTSDGEKAGRLLLQTLYFHTILNS